MSRDETMDNNGFPYLPFLQGYVEYPASCEAQQAEQSAGPHQPAFFSGWLTRLANPAQPEIRPPPPTYDEYMSRQRVVD